MVGLRRIVRRYCAAAGSSLTRQTWPLRKNSCRCSASVNGRAPMRPKLAALNRVARETQVHSAPDALLDVRAFQLGWDGPR